MTRDPLCFRCILLLSETVGIRQAQRKAPSWGTALSAVLACQEAAQIRIERVERLERSDRLDRRRQEHTAR
ncbi:MAG: hypothetical protein GX774_20135 [Armatimonadetes bacterium]|nr:hypothetical protein [Armatimonadota bacterium]